MFVTRCSTSLSRLHFSFSATVEASNNNAFNQTPTKLVFRDETHMARTAIFVLLEPQVQSFREREPSIAVHKVAW